MQSQYNIIRVDFQHLRARTFRLPRNSRHVSHSDQVGSIERHASKPSDVTDEQPTAEPSDQASVALNVVVHLCHKTLHTKLKNVTVVKM